MDRRRGFGALFWIVGILLVVGVGVVAYNLGVSQGLEASGQVDPDGYRGPYIGGDGFGFGFFGLLFPLLFILLLFGLFRAAAGGWRGHDHYYGRPWGPGGPGGWQGGPPPMFEEWHRRAHGETPSEGSPTEGPPTGQGVGR